MVRGQIERRGLRLSSSGDACLRAEYSESDGSSSSARVLCPLASALAECSIACSPALRRILNCLLSEPRLCEVVGH